MLGSKFTEEEIEIGNEDPPPAVVAATNDTTLGLDIVTPQDLFVAGPSNLDNAYQFPETNLQSAALTQTPEVNGVVSKVLSKKVSEDFKWSFASRPIAVATFSLPKNPTPLKETPAPTVKFPPELAELLAFKFKG